MFFRIKFQRAKFEISKSQNGTLKWHLEIIHLVSKPHEVFFCTLEVVSHTNQFGKVVSWLVALTDYKSYHL